MTFDRFNSKLHNSESGGAAVSAKSNFRLNNFPTLKVALAGVTHADAGRGWARGARRWLRFLFSGAVRGRAARAADGAGGA